MLDLGKNIDFNEIFTGLGKRRENSAYFLRAPGYNDKIGDLAVRFFSASGVKGARFQGKLQSPSEEQVSFFVEILGRDFNTDKFFVGKSLARWLPQLTNTQCDMLADAMCAQLSRFQRLGKNEAMLKNLYIRLMCWLYYKLSGVISHIGDDEPPKVLYIGTPSRHELYLLRLLYECKCDVLLMLTEGESEYDKLDPAGELSQKLTLPGMQPYPQGFGLETLQSREADAKMRQQLLSNKAQITAATNIWLSGSDMLEDIKKTPVTRGDKPGLFYNAFCRMTGVEDKLTYQNELYKFYIEIKNSGRRFLILEERIPMPTNNELAGIDRSQYKTKEQLIGAMLKCIQMPPNDDLRRLMATAFAEVLLDEAERPDMTEPRFNTMAVCVACWLNRYGPMLFSGWAMPLVSLFVYLGGCQNSHETAFLRVLSRLPCDVLILVPNLNTKCRLEDTALFELKYTQTLNMTQFPTEASAQQFGTAAYHAERELDEALYSGTGLFRDYQYKKANSVILKTMYEEIEMLWKQETRFRPNFSVIDDTVNVPVIFAKVSGVKDSQPAKYWKGVQQLLTDNTFVIYGAPFIPPNWDNPLKHNSAALIRGGKLQRDVILRSSFYQYRHLREETQTYIFDKIDLLMNAHIISGTYENGTEYLIAATLLNLPPQIVKLIQGFDFTKVNPKIIYINLGEIPISLEDSIVLAFLSLAGFDVLFLVPTGYQTVEGFFSKNILDEHKVGEYMYDLQTPKLKTPKPKPKTPANKNKPLFGGLFRKVK